MKNLVIIGAGGMGKEIYYTAMHSIGINKDYVVKGFIDDDLTSMDGFKGYPPLLSTIKDYLPEENDVFVCSLGNVQTKYKVCEMIKSRGGKFQTIIHMDAQVRENTIIGDGTIVDSYAMVGSNSTIGENCLIQAFSVVGHDAVVGDYCRVDVRSLMVGGVIVGNRVTIHTNAVVSHKVVLGDDSIVGALSFVIKKVKPGATVYGNPAKQL